MTVKFLSKEESIQFLDFFFEWFLTTYDGCFPNDVNGLTSQLRDNLCREFETCYLYPEIAEMSKSLINGYSSFYIDKSSLDEYDIRSIASMKLL